MSSNPIKKSLLGIAVLAAVSGAAFAANEANLSGADRTFITKAATGGMAEVQLGKLAGEKAKNDRVKQFGAHMVDDHTKANEELMKIATAKGVTPPADLDAAHKRDMDKLSKLSGPAFDRAYMDAMAADHKKTIAEFEKTAKSGKDADLKAFAGKTLPTLREHMTMVQTTRDAIKNEK